MTDQSPPGTEPTGRQYRLRHGDQEVVVTEVGAGLRSYTVGTRAVLDGFAAGELCTAARGQMLIPWPNRVRDGRYRFGGVDEVLALTEPEAGNAIHGLTRWANWVAAEHTGASLVMRHTLHAQQGWPHVLGCEVAFTLADSGLRVRTTVTNHGARACPYASGAHPYLRVGGATADGATADQVTIDEATLHLPARTRYVTDERAIPVSRTPVRDTAPQRIGDRVIDTTFTDLLRDPDGLVRVRLAAPGDGPVVTLWADTAYRWIQVFTGDGVPEPWRRRTGLAVEPMTAPPDALRTGEGLVTLQPGQRHSAAWGIEPGR